jgi:hypothetical protein
MLFLTVTMIVSDSFIFLLDGAVEAEKAIAIITHKAITPIMT